MAAAHAAAGDGGEPRLWELDPSGDALGAPRPNYLRS